MYFFYELNLIYEVPYCKLSLISAGLSLQIFASGFRGACKQSWAGAYYTSFRLKLPNCIKLNCIHFYIKLDRGLYTRGKGLAFVDQNVSVYM